MKLTKSLFVEFVGSPKLARWHVNDKKTYEAIQAEMYGGMDGVAIGQSVEDLAMEVLCSAQNIQMSTIDTANMRKDRHGTYHSRTTTVIAQRPEVIYQPAFLIGDVFVKCDFLVRNPQGTFDLVEVKAKNSIRKTTKEAPLLDDLAADVSIQHRALKRALGDAYSGRCWIAHLNKTYVKNGPIQAQDLILSEEVTAECRDDAMIESVLETMRQTLPLSLEQFTARYPYDGSDYFTFFGTKPPEESIWMLPRISKEQKKQLFDAGKIMIADLDADAIEGLKNNKGEHTTASRGTVLRQQGECVVDKEAVQKELDTLVYPLYFYDYETINGPIPVIEGTSPRQQVVVQYSLHKVAADGTITHHEALIEPGATTNEQILKHMIDAMDGAMNGTRIVRRKGFENARNTERAAIFPEYAMQLEYINAHTFDLMEIFSKQLYFHRGFHGSSSIKKVLPVLTDISYDGLAVQNGAVAMDLLMHLVTGQLDRITLETVKKNLLTYCEQDSRAMVRIWQSLVISH